MSNLSDRQRHILEFIVDFVNENEFPPTIREIGDRVGISSTSVVNYNLAKLEELGLISRRKEVSRGLSLNWDHIQKFMSSEDTGLATASSLRTFAKDIGALADNLLRVPVLGHIAAGEPIQVEPSDPNTTDEWVELPQGSLRSSDSLFALRVRGDSMIDASVLDGDVVILRSQESADDGDMVAAWIEGDEETTLKYLYREGSNVRLQPANPNPEYQPIIRPANTVRINGRVVSVLRLFDQ